MYLFVESGDVWVFVIALSEGVALFDDTAYVLRE